MHFLFVFYAETDEMDKNYALKIVQNSTDICIFA